jgi:alpha-glucuronidase
MNDLRAFHLIYSAIKYYQIFGATPEIRDELLTVARRAIGTNPQTLSAAASQIEIMIASLKAERQCHG